LGLPFSTYYCKNYYEPAKTEIECLLPEGTQSVLSVGCGWGETEQWLSKKGVRVIAVPIDPVIAASAQARGIEVVHGNIDRVRRTLASHRFDCVLLSNVLHLVENPTKLLESFSELLSNDGVVVAIVPNLLRVPDFVRHVRSRKSFTDIGSYERTGVHLASGRTLRKWCRDAGLRVSRIVNSFPEHSKGAARTRVGWLGRLLASELIVLARPAKARRAIVVAGDVSVVGGGHQSPLSI